uniref:Protein kinase domain-containing protein n=1 Tax=Chlamydomonas leiostraca TaxID=1034604 RepID=A0A7S0R4E3_9CHLO
MGLVEVAATVQSVTESIAAASPGPLQAPVQVIGGDIASLVAGAPSIPGLARLGALYYALGTKPGPVAGLLDFFVVAPVADNTANRWRSRDFVLRDKLGGGNFGVTFEGVKVEKGERGTVSQRGGLTAEQKRKRVVLKRVNQDRSEVRGDFLKAGTMAKGAAESGKVEAYMCAKVKRNPLVAACCAQYLGYFISEESDGAFTKGSQWLVWKFESDATLGDALDGRLGEFPACLEEFVLGRVNDKMDEDKRDTLVIKSLLRQVLQGISRLHSIGIVHRDIKPGNILFDSNSAMRLADFGLAVDLTTERANTRLGTLAFMAPEVVQCPVKANPAEHKHTRGGPEYSAAADVWACGVLMYAMLTGGAAIKGNSTHEILLKIMSSNPAEHVQLDLPDHIMSPAAKEFICACLQPVPVERPTVNELLQHPSVVRHVQSYLDALSAAGPSGWSTWRMKLPPSMLAQMASVIAQSRASQDAAQEAAAAAASAAAAAAAAAASPAKTQSDDANNAGNGPPPLLPQQLEDVMSSTQLIEGFSLQSLLQDVPMADGPSAAPLPMDQQMLISTMHPDDLARLQPAAPQADWGKYAELALLQQQANYLGLRL